MKKYLKKFKSPKLTKTGKQLSGVAHSPEWDKYGKKVECIKDTGVALWVMIFAYRNKNTWVDFDVIVLDDIFIHAKTRFRDKFYIVKTNDHNKIVAEKVARNNVYPIG